MIKQLLLPLFISSSLFSKDIEEMDKIIPLAPEVEKSIYIEATLFVAVFVLMSIISIVISKKHAKQNLLKDKEKREKQKAQEAKVLVEEKKSQTDKESDQAERVIELSKMLKDGLITNEEFQVLSHASQKKSQKTD